MYLIKWMGYPSSENTWEPEENIAHCDKFIEYQRQKLKRLSSAKPDGKKKDSKRARTEPPRAELAVVDPCLWVQCDSCGKWRAFPPEKEANTLFDLKKIENAVFKCPMTPGIHKISCSTPEFGQGEPPKR